MKTGRILTCVAGLVIVLSQQARAEDIPTPALGCHIFDAKGRAVRPSAMTDKQLMQAMNCEQVAEAQAVQSQASADSQADFNQRMAKSDADLAKLNDDLASAYAVSAKPISQWGTAAHIDTPLPYNTPAIVIQTR